MKEFLSFGGLGMPCMLQGYVGILFESNYFAQSWIAQPPSVDESFLVMGMNFQQKTFELYSGNLT